VRPSPLIVLLLAAPASCIEEPPPPPPPPAIAQIVRPEETHLPEVRQLTTTGENGASRWAWSDPAQLALQMRANAGACPRVMRVTLEGPAAPTLVIEGESPAPLPAGGGIVYAAPPKCARGASAPADAIRVDSSFDVYRAKADGSDPARLTDNPGFDGEPSVCGKDGAIVFSSMRDGDVDLYRMDSDGSHLQRLTATAGYDGGPVFDADCKHVAWHASRPKGKELDEYKAQLAEGVLRPAQLELWIANADGTDARQITYLDARSSSPAWYPGEARVLFASSFGGESARDVDLWAIDLDGTNLERVTTAPGIDAAPAFSPDGKWLAFASARGTPLGSNASNVFAARWFVGTKHVEERTADHLMGDSAWLADRAREGRALGTKGLDDAGAYLERSFRSFGLAPAGDAEFRQAFDVTTAVSAAVTLQIAGVPVPASQAGALGFSRSGSVDGPMAYVGSNEDYERVDVKGKVVVVRAGGSLHHAARMAHEHGAVGLLAVADSSPAEPTPETSAGIVAATVSREGIGPILDRIVRGGHPAAHLAVTLAPETAPAFNVVARWPASVPEAERLPGVIVIGAHYDGSGGPSPGADDNASGTAALLQVARSLGEKKPALRRGLVLAAFSGEEQGAAGAAAFVRHPPGGIAAKDVLVMIDLDMVGRLRDDTLQVFGADTAAEWPDLLRGACNAAHVDCRRATGGGLGGADRLPFYEAGVPSVQLFTGVHADHHKATDTPAALNATGMAQVARIAEHLARDVSDLGGRLAFDSKAAPPGEGESRSFGASLGTIPDRSGPPGGQKGMLLGGVRPGGPADKAGLRRGDVLVRLAGHVVGGVEDVMFMLTQSKPGAQMKAVVVRDGKELAVDVTLDAPGAR
jgi:hypothetical protein